MGAPGVCIRTGPQVLAPAISGRSPLLIGDELLAAFDVAQREAERLAFIGVVDPEAAILGRDLLPPDGQALFGRQAVDGAFSREDRTGSLSCVGG